MSNSVLAQIEDGFKQLSTSEQLWLIGRLVHHVHEATLKQFNDVDQELAFMASDPQIQNELRSIEQDFLTRSGDEEALERDEAVAYYQTLEKAE